AASTNDHDAPSQAAPGGLQPHASPNAGQLSHPGSCSVWFCFGEVWPYAGISGQESVNFPLIEKAAVKVAITYYGQEARPCAADKRAALGCTTGNSVVDDVRERIGSSDPATGSRFVA